nr:iron-binding protein [Candidatus Aenigmarchaeota archaeon]
MSKTKKKCKIVISSNGPYLVYGGLPLAKEIIVPDSEGTPIRWKKGETYPTRENYRLCRCGKSQNKPYCDQTHRTIEFDGTETTSKKPYREQARRISGPDLILTDVESLCALARFCDRALGVWQLTRESDDPEYKEIAIQETLDC